MAIHQDGETRLQELKAAILARSSHVDQLYGEIGALLVEARKFARGGRWGKFLSELGIADKTAQRYMKLAKAFEGEFMPPNATLSRLEEIASQLRRKGRSTKTSTDDVDLTPEDAVRRISELEERTETAERLKQMAENRLARVNATVANAPQKVIDANLSLRGLDMAFARAIQTLDSLTVVEKIHELDWTIVKSINARSDRLFALLAASQQRPA